MKFAKKLKKEDIGEYLMTLDIVDPEDCKVKFLEFGVDGSVMVDITDEDLEDIGVELKSDRFKIRKKFKPWLTSKQSN